jgi:hypothetical protein
VFIASALNFGLLDILVLGFVQMGEVEGREKSSLVILQAD